MLILRLSFVFVMLVSISAHGAENFIEIWGNNQAVNYLDQDKRLEAHEQFTQLLSAKPFHPLYQYNTGLSFLVIEEVDKAIKMYQELLKNPSSTDEVNLPANYNLGVIFGAKGEVDKALQYYQKALELSPDSVEVKTNIELLLKNQKGKGKGKGKNNKDKNKKDQKNKDDSEGDEQEKEPQKFQNQPNQFKSKEMSKSDVKKILEELKKQEQRIRAKHDRKGGKEADRDKNW